MHPSLTAPDSPDGQSCSFCYFTTFLLLATCLPRAYPPHCFTRVLVPRTSFCCYACLIPYTYSVQSCTVIYEWLPICFVFSGSAFFTCMQHGRWSLLLFPRVPHLQTVVIPMETSARSIILSSSSCQPAILMIWPILMQQRLEEKRKRLQEQLWASFLVC